ncbi:MAG TPA: malonyl-ACP O-methyltransferase BioC [Hyphomicrobiales bacterium]|nr:malonyl-ACP O-methyltransferase BioC [Hyphomicrobiales bacterium]
MAEAARWQSAPVATEIARERIARAFAQAALHYDAHAALQREVAQALCALLPENTPQTLLDLGCGTGYCAALLRQRYPQATLLALDLALPMLQRVAASPLGAQDVAPALLLCADAAALPLAPASLDLVCSSLTLQWCPQPGQVFSELHRVLRPGGRALLSTFGPDSLAELSAAWATVDDHRHVNQFEPIETLERAAQDSGLRLTLQRQPSVRWYANLRELSRELKGIGAHNMNATQRPGLTGRQAFQRAERAFAAGGQGARGVPVTYDLLYLSLERLP